MPDVKRKYGWRRQKYDPRDRHLSLVIEVLPTRVDLRSQMPAVYDQGQLGSCTANAISAAYAYELTRQGLPSYNASRLAIYYHERLLEHKTRCDSGATIRESAKVVANYGAPNEDMWPYIIAKYRRRPPAAVDLNASHHRATQYEAVAQNSTAMRGCLAAGRPFVLGFTVYDSFETATVAQTGIVPMPAHGESVLGGHAVVAVGYDDTTRRFICRNSWGANWGQAGYFEIDYSYLLDSTLAGDFWTLDVVQ